MYSIFLPTYLCVRLGNLVNLGQVQLHEIVDGLITQTGLFVTSDATRAWSYVRLGLHQSGSGEGDGIGGKGVGAGGYSSMFVSCSTGLILT